MPHFRYNIDQVMNVCGHNMLPPDIRQTPVFARFMSDLGWEIESIGKGYIYYRKFPLIGYFAKMPRASLPIPLSNLVQFIHKKHVFKFKLSPYVQTTRDEYLELKEHILTSGFSIEKSPFNPTITIQIDLKKNPDDLFSSFSEAKRRAVRKAIKNGVIVVPSEDISPFISIRHHQYRPLGFLVTNEMKLLWKHLYPAHATLLLAYSHQGRPVGGILLLHYGHISYYWYASALPEGKKLFAPTFLVWEALKMSRTRNCHMFDFEGVYDDRFPKASESWKGFTKFKEGFGGQKVVFMENFTT